ncbi:hypothetical protein ABZ799_26695 [Nocardiopsis dassonvillei]|uniref:hypothetical protein n=1 Tax=Nocardiopsis dassonvillei TaxID=2014 RepID=UPI0033C1D673
MATPSSPRKRVRGYFRKDGTYVSGYYRSRPAAPGQSPRSQKEASTASGVIALVFFLIVVGYLLG